MTWTPCAFLACFSCFEGIDLLRSLRHPDKRTPVPWTLVARVKVLLSYLLLLVSAAELVVAVVDAVSGSTAPVHYVTPLIKLLTMLLATGILLLRRKVSHSHSVLLFLFWLMYAFVSLFSLYSIVKFLVEPVSPSRFLQLESVVSLSLSPSLRKHREKERGSVTSDQQSTFPRSSATSSRSRSWC